MLIFVSDELHQMFTEAGLEKVQNLVDRASLQIPKPQGLVKEKQLCALSPNPNFLLRSKITSSRRGRPHLVKQPEGKVTHAKVKDEEKHHGRRY